MSEFVFILGAGSSREAGAPLMSDFLERAEALLGGISVEPYATVAKTIAAMQIAHSKADLDLYNIESIFGAFEMARLIGVNLPGFENGSADSKLAALRSVIAKTLEAAIHFPHGKTLMPEYELFSRLLTGLNRGAPNGYRCSLITFNYDLVIDHLLWAGMHSYEYGLEQRAQHMPLLKLHGSLNWAKCSECGAVVPWHLGHFFSVPRSFGPGKTIKLQLASQLPQSGLSHCPGKQIEPTPVIVPPTWNKTEYHLSLGRVWARAAMELSDAENIFVIGYSLPETDAFFRYLYALGTIGERLVKRFWVFDLDIETVKPRFERLLGKAVKQRFQFFREPFPNCVPRFMGEFRDRLS